MPVHDEGLHVAIKTLCFVLLFSGHSGVNAPTWASRRLKVLLAQTLKKTPFFRDVT